MQLDDSNSVKSVDANGNANGNGAAAARDEATRVMLDVDAIRTAKANGWPVRIGSDMPPRPPRDARPLDILVLEDDESTRRLLQVALTQLGHQVIASSCLKDATTLLRTFVFDLLLCDLNLPDGSGLDVLKEIPPGTGIHAIVLSGMGEEEDMKRSLAAGFDDHLVKPIDLVLLQRAVWKSTGQTL